ncbi:Phytoalexin-deficient 4-2 protein [Dorcoceras hygrometricum]|uniref:Phytoalexin-deficient 4-2 protein n=1 Tax=Dorcoceras hygrometricum TaxID=472368 RepID=A0A2Z7BI29_9LAMI|nr:Phytoalexin-deficient 4-2 protein [Dorcoceras hygrometricum]
MIAKCWLLKKAPKAGLIATQILPAAAHPQKDKYKERSSDRKMKTNNNKRFSRKHDRKVLVAEESTKSWADSDSDSSSSSSSSSESEQEEVHCFMADQTDEDEVFDFSNVEFTRDDLVIALKDMVKEYRKLSHSFEEAKAENISLKSSSAESSSDELEDADILKTELSKLQAENELLRNEISKLKAEVAKATVELSSWNKANITLQKICENQKQASDKTGIGFNDSEFCEGESSTQSRPAHDKFNKMSFVKADMIYNCLESWEAERPVVMASDTEDEDIATVDVAPADEVQQVQDFEAPISAEDVLSADEKMSLDDILLSIPVDIPLPSTCMEVTKIKMGQMIKIPGVTEKTWFLNSLPRIPADDKGKEILVEKDPVKGNPAAEHYSLICADIDLLVSLRAKFIDEVATFFNSFSLKKLASINFEEMYRKEEQVLSWGETESPQEAIQRKFYILLKYRTILVWKFLDAWRVNFAPGQGSSAVDIQVIELLSDLYLYFLEELAKEARNLGLTWTKPGCSKIFEGCPRDRGAVIARSNSNTRSLCWIRRMLLVDGLWAVELCADRWVKIPTRIISTEVPRQRKYDDTLPTMSIFFKLLRKRWADVCVEVVEFGASPRLLPIGSTQFCRSLQLAEPVSSFAPSRPTVFALRFSQFCSVFVDLSLFSWLPSTDISEFLSAIALDRTILRSVQRYQDSFAVAPSVQLSLEQHQSSSSSDSSSSLLFDQTDIDATASSRPTISPDLSAVFADFQAALSEQIFASQSEISSRMHKLEQSVCDSLRDQADIFRNLFQGARQETHTLDDVHTIRFNEFRKTVLTQNATMFQGLADVRKEVDAVNAKVDIMAKLLTDIQKDAEATKEALSHQLLEFQSSEQENHNVIHAQLSELVDYIHRGSADKKGESGSRGLQKPANTQKEGSAVTPSFEQRVQMAQRRIVQTVLDADANRAMSQEAAERDRERRRKEAKSLKRRRKD